MEIRDDESEIYDGTEGFEEEFMEEVYESVNTSNLSGKVIVEASSELEYSKDNQAQFEEYREESSQHIPDENEDEEDVRLSQAYEEYKRGEEKEFSGEKKDTKERRDNKLRNYDVENPNQNRTKETQPNSENYFTYDKRKLKAIDSMEKIIVHQGDEDTYSQQLSERKLEVTIS